MAERNNKEKTLNELKKADKKAEKGGKVEMTADELQKSRANRGQMRGVKVRVENGGAIFKRLVAMVMKAYGVQYILVIVCIFVSVLANVRGTMFTQTLIDTYIMPMIGQANVDYGPLLGAMSRVAVFYAIGIIASFTQQKIMVYIGQGMLLKVRKQMFEHMESLPIRYFDRHSHGDIMSIYTNDVDTLRQMISQSIPQFVNSAVTIVSVLDAMIILSVPLTLVTLVMVAFTVFA